jgi:hypothetical protein
MAPGPRDAPLVHAVNSEVFMSSSIFRFINVHLAAQKYTLPFRVATKTMVDE